MYWNKQFGSAMLAAGSLAFLASCGESQLTRATVTLSSQAHPNAKSSSTFDATAGELLLPTQLCYVIHVSGPGITEIPGDEDLCGPESGQGFMTPQAYRVGETAELTLTSTGSPRIFELIGFASPLGVDENGVARCGTSAQIEYEAAALTDEPRHTSFKLKVDGQKVTSGLVKFYSGEKPSLAPGQEEVTLFQWPKSSDALVENYAFGVPFFRQDVADEKPEGCLATGESWNGGSSIELLVEHSGTGITNPVVSANSSAAIIQINHGPVGLPASGLSIPSSTGGTAVLNLGLPKVIKESFQ